MRGTPDIITMNSFSCSEDVLSKIGPPGRKNERDALITARKNLALCFPD